MQYQAPIDLLKNRTILVTGATDGIGREAAFTYARHGARLILLGRNQQKLDHLSAEIHHKFGQFPSIFKIDFALANADDYQELAKHIALVAPAIDGVLHNAGMLGKILPLMETPPTLWQQVMKVNLEAPFLLTQAIMPILLRAEKASLIFTTSSVGRQGREGWGAYAMSKFATEGMVQVLAEELTDTTVRVNCINPGGTRTQMRANAYPNEDSLKLKTPGEIMPLYLWLMGDDSINAQGESFDAQPGRKPGPAA
ncbi:YciK family oxidoreductase [Rosenbergiella australiborealis]|uniref:YciK family oxidoreductase n=1 Tax=Rosenbergiella australiborealis TaxID=1544696 RepID=A0ABS5T4L1_9GAMM|nr:YciK family oxidoreductase [Rosenbergiella australiborealis]MBT0726362.1 YciK family oxidoreductase [Rosenbergiella australiborealis]